MATADDRINPSLRERIHFLQQPQSYPEKPDSVQIVQTHISVVALAGNYAYKLKKPVNFDFLDFSSLDQRRYYCQKEIELNSRLCPDIYLGILPIYQGKKGLYFGTDFLNASDSPLESDKDPVEFAIKMKRLPDHQFLSHKITHGSLESSDLRRTAQKLARFYRQQKKSTHSKQTEHLETIQQNIDENFRQTEPFVDSLVNPIAHEIIHYFTDRFIQRHAKLFKQRIEERAIVDGHGDLHLDHIHVNPKRVCIYDCIEFNERFRFQDIANDLAFLAMDLDRYEQFELSQQFIGWMTRELEDRSLYRLIDFYKCYRAVVRAKVEAMKSTEDEVSEHDQSQSRDMARRYFHLALRYAVIGSQPIALIVMGRIGTGKSTLSRALAEELDLHRFNSDRIRKELAGLPVREASPKSIHDYLYSQEMSDRTYTALMERSINRLKEGHSVILDATFSRKAKREELIQYLRNISVPYYFIEMQSADRRIKKRLRKRDQYDNIISDARLENFEPLNKIYQSPDEIDDEHHLSMNTEQSVAESIRLLFEKLVKAHVEQV